MAPQSTQQPRTNLLMGADEARNLLTNRIKQGKDLSSRDIPNPSYLKKCWADFRTWADYNSELLKRMFDTDEFYNYYNPAVVVASGYANNLLEGILEYTEEVEDSTSLLESILGRLDLLQIVEASPAEDIQLSAQPREKSNRIFLVHGHDEQAKLAVARFLEKLKLEPIILHEQPNRSRTIIEKFEAYADVAFAVVILSPDDVGAPKGNVSDLQPRARQNVVFELGFFIGHLERENVCALYKGEVQLPSDYDGMLYVPMDDRGAWKNDLARELKSVGIEFDADGLI